MIFQQVATFTQAERINSIVFHKLPQDYQLYPRDANNEVTVPISRIIDLTGFNYVSVQVYRNDVLVKYLRAEINIG